MTTILTQTKKEALAFRKKLKAFLNNLLSNILENPQKREMLLSEDFMPIWEKAFTHTTFDPKNNYESLEYLGDRILKAIFPLYVADNYGMLTNSQFSNLETYYMKGEYQGPLANEIGFSPHIRLASDEVTLALEGDVFESFFGALNDVSDKLVFGLGFQLCYNMFSYIFEKYIELDLTKSGNNIKTLMGQIFDRFSVDGKQLKPFKFESLEKPDKWQLYFTDKGINFLESKGFLQKNKYRGKLVLAQTRGEQKKAEKKAYEIAYEFFLNLGITNEWAIKEKNNDDMMFVKSVDEKLYKDFIKKLNREGLHDPFYFVDKKTETKDGGNINQLRAQDENEEPVLLASDIKLRAEKLNTQMWRLKLIRDYTYRR